MTIDQVLPLFNNFAADYSLVFHNAAFDRSIISREYAKYLKENLSNSYYDTMKIWKSTYYDCFRQFPASSKLECLVDNILPDEERQSYKAGMHNSDSDALATARVFLKMI